MGMDHVHIQLDVSNQNYQFLQHLVLSFPLPFFRHITFTLMCFGLSPYTSSILVTVPAIGIYPH